MQISHKKYENRDAYVAHQVSKTQEILKSPKSTEALLRQDQKYRIQLYESLDYEFVSPGANVLCLGARAGGEVKAFIDKGCFALGIDLYPLPRSKYVLRGDFNHIQYAADSVDIIFTNTLDHTNDLLATIQEARRVLRHGGHLIVEIMSDSDSWSDPWRCCEWSSVDDVIQVFIEAGFQLTGNKSLPAKNMFGRQLCFVVSK